MKQIIILLAIFALAGCTKSHSEVQAAETKCRELGGALDLLLWSGGSVHGYSCIIKSARYYEGDF